MDTNVIIGLLSLLGTIIGTFGGIMVSNKLVNYRLEVLEEKVAESNKLIDRIYNLEKHNEVQDTKITAIEENIDSIKRSM